MKEGVKDHYRVNERIRARFVRLIDQNGAQLGVVPRDKAIQIAREQGLDLVEVAANTDPPVCKVLDFGKFIYEIKKKSRDSKKHKNLREKEIVMRPNIDKHDAAIKINHAREFLIEGHKVIFQVRQRGREVEHSERGRGLLENIKKGLSDVSKVEKDINSEGKLLFLTLSPKIGGGQVEKEKSKQSSGKQISSNSPGQSPLPQSGQGAPASGQNS